MDGDANSFVRLIDAVRAEIAALDSEDADAIEAATAAKLAALKAVQDDIAGGAPPQRALLDEATDAQCRSRAAGAGQTDFGGAPAGDCGGRGGEAGGADLRARRPLGLGPVAT